MSVLMNTRTMSGPVPGAPRNIAASPSDMTFGWSECRRCVYNKIVRGLKRPSMPMPSIFNSIDRAMKTCFMDQRIPAYLTGLPDGSFYAADGWVESVPLLIPGHTVTISVRGRYDTILAFDDGTFGICDFKTSSPKAAHVAFYGRQLHAYLYALENPAANKPQVTPISRLGLIAWEPNTYKQRDVHDSGINGYFGGRLHWVDVPRDDIRFLAFLDEMLTVLERPNPPAASPECSFCNFLDNGHRVGW